MTRKQRRLAVLAVCGLGLGTATALTLLAFNDTLVFFVSPSDLAAHPGARSLRLGGLVTAGSVQRTTVAGKPVTEFRVTDGQAIVAVRYVGILPDLFREGQGAVALGHVGADGVFVADEVLAKHDETYMPKDVADALRAKGLWRPEDGKPPTAATWNALLPTARATAQTTGGG